MLGTVGPERTQRGGPGRCQLRPRGLPLAGANRRRPPCRVIERGVTQGRLGRGGSPAVASERSSAADRCHHVATPATRASTACRLRGPARSRAPPDAPPSPQDAPSPPTTHSTTVLRTPPTAPGPYPRRRMSLDSEEVLDAFTLVLELGGSVQTVNARGETALHGAAARAPTRSSRCSPSEAPVWMRPTTPDIPRWRSPRVSRSWCSDSSPRPQLSSVGWWRVARRRPARHGDTPTCRCLGRVWDFSTITPLERPDDLAGKEFWTDLDAGIEPEPASGRALQPRRRRLAALRVYGCGSDHVDEAVDGAGVHEEDRGSDLRVRVPRGQLRPLQHPRCRAGGGEGRRRSHKSRIPVRALNERQRRGPYRGAAQPTWPRSSDRRPQFAPSPSTGSILSTAPASWSVVTYSRPSGPCLTSRMRWLSSVSSGM